MPEVDVLDLVAKLGAPLVGLGVVAQLSSIKTRLGWLVDGHKDHETRLRAMENKRRKEDQ